MATKGTKDTKDDSVCAGGTASKKLVRGVNANIGGPVNFWLDGGEGGNYNAGLGNYVCGLSILKEWTMGRKVRSRATAFGSGCVVEALEARTLMSAAPSLAVFSF